MSIFDQLGQQGQRPRQMDPEQQRRMMQADLDKIKSGPAAFLQQRGYNIPEGMSDAQQITQYLLRSGQIPGSRLQGLMQFFGGGRR